LFQIQLLFVKFSGQCATIGVDFMIKTVKVNEDKVKVTDIFVIYDINL
jgi:hypothetical protein